MIVRERREAKGLSQQQLAKEVGLTQTAISLIESGLRYPSVQTAKKLGKVLDFNWTELYDDQPCTTAEE